MMAAQLLIQFSCWLHFDHFSDESPGSSDILLISAHLKIVHIYRGYDLKLVVNEYVWPAGNLSKAL